MNSWRLFGEQVRAWGRTSLLLSVRRQHGATAWVDTGQVRPIAQKDALCERGRGENRAPSGASRQGFCRASRGGPLGVREQGQRRVGVVAGGQDAPVRPTHRRLVLRRS